MSVNPSSHVKALDKLIWEINSWGDYEQSESSEEYFPDPIEKGDPVHAAVVVLQAYYPRNHLPKPAGALDAWVNLAKYSRQHGEGTREEQCGKAEKGAKDLYAWAISEIERLRRDGKGNAECWITITEAERLSGISKGTISRAANNGKIETNGEKKRARRLNNESFTQWALKRAESPVKPREDFDNVIREAEEAKRKRDTRSSN